MQRIENVRGRDLEVGDFIVAETSLNRNYQQGVKVKEVHHFPGYVRVGYFNAVEGKTLYKTYLDADRFTIERG